MIDEEFDKLMKAVAEENVYSALTERLDEVVSYVETTESVEIEPLFDGYKGLLRAVMTRLFSRIRKLESELNNPVSARDKWQALASAARAEVAAFGGNESDWDEEGKALAKALADLDNG